MTMQDERSPCEADALFDVKAITVNKKTFGLAGLTHAIAAVQAMNLTRDDQLMPALLKEVGKANFIPPPLREAYGPVLLKEYHAVNDQQKSALK